MLEEDDFTDPEFEFGFHDESDALVPCDPRRSSFSMEACVRPSLRQALLNGSSLWRWSQQHPSQARALSPLIRDSELEGRAEMVALIHAALDPEWKSSLGWQARIASPKNPLSFKAIDLETIYAKRSTPLTPEDVLEWSGFTALLKLLSIGDLDELGSSSARDICQAAAELFHRQPCDRMSPLIERHELGLCSAKPSSPRSSLKRRI